MIPIPASILAIENESDRDFMENIFFSYQRLIYHEIGSILNDPWSKDDIFQTVIVQLINNIDTLRPMPAKVLTSYIATSARNAALTYIRNISRRKEILADEFDNSNVDDIVFDPCMGSGSSCLVAAENDRRYVGVELKQKYYDLAVQRMQELQ